MKKIITLFQRNHNGDYLVRDEVTPGAEWVIVGEGIASRKWDGACCMIKEGKFYKRLQIKKDKTTPFGFIPVQERDAITGELSGWIEVGIGPEDKWFREALVHTAGVNIQDGTYELVGPKINGNPEKLEVQALIRHGVHTLDGCVRSFEGIRNYLRKQDIEGIVWHHSDGRMVKIKKRDFGLRRGV